MDVRAIDHPPNKLSITDDFIDDDEEDEDPSPMMNNDEEHVLDSTMEMVERLLDERDFPPELTITLVDDTEDMKEKEESIREGGIETELPRESTLVLDDTDEKNEKEDSASEDAVHGDEVRETINESCGASQDVLTQRMDDIERIVQTLKRNVESSQDMSSVAPWDKNGTGFASNYMRKNGHQPGKGLGKSENGIPVPISAEKKTFHSETPAHTWPQGTVLIAGASMIQGLEENKMSRSGRVKVRSHGGATIRDMRDHLNAILRKEPTRLILHVHSNDASNKATTSDDLYDGLMDLKRFAESKVKNIKVTFSCPIIRTDNAIANAKQIQLKNRLKRSGLDVIENDDITEDDLGKKGLHLKPSGSTKLAKNILQYLRSV